jgi:hypothetical protein
MCSCQGLLGLVLPVMLASTGASRVAAGDEPAFAPVASPPPPVDAQSTPPPARLSFGAHLGLGELSFRFDSYSFWGRSYPVEAWLGLSLSDELVLFGEFYDAHVFDPSSTFAAMAGLDLLGFGLGGKYYLRPGHIYLSVSLLLSRVRFDNGVVSLWGDGINERTHWGPTGRLALGKDWQVSRGWRLGLEGDVMFGGMDFAWTTGGDEQSSTVRGFSLLGSASYGYQAPSRARTRATGETSDVGSLPVSPDATPAGRHTHDGLYVGARLGVGWLRVEGSNLDPLSGWGRPFALSIGYAFARTLVVFGEFYALQVRHPAASGYLTDLDLVASGPGVTYYVPGINAFASLSASLSQLGYRDGTPLDTRYGTNQTSHWGVTGRLSLGKEWWVSSNWGLGLAAEVLLGRMGKPDEPQYDEHDRHYTAKGFSLLASASFN